MPAEAPQPRLNLLEPLEPQAIEALGTLLPAAEQPTVLENPEVMDHGLRGERKDVAKLAQANVTVHQAFEEPAPRGIGERPEASNYARLGTLIEGPAGAMPQENITRAPLTLWYQPRCSPRSSTLPPIAAVLMVSVRSVAKRSR